MGRRYVAAATYFHRGLKCLSMCGGQHTFSSTVEQEVS